VDLDDAGRGSHGLSSDRSEPLTPGGLDSMWITRRKLKLEIKRSPLRTTSVVRLDTASEQALSMFGSNENTKATQTPQDIYIYGPILSLTITRALHGMKQQTCAVPYTFVSVGKCCGT
jgi:hypothetical protein